MLTGVMVGVGQVPANATSPVTAVRGSAFGFYTDVSLFDGPRVLRGYGTSVPPIDESYSPSVTLPTGGSSVQVTEDKVQGATGKYGPASIFAGQWSEDGRYIGPSGPLSVSTEGTAEGGSVTSSAHVVLDEGVPGSDFTWNGGDDGPGGFGPGPLIGDEGHSTCTADASGVSGSATFFNGIIETKYDEFSQEPIPEYVVPIPSDPPPNWKISGSLDHIVSPENGGERFTIVLNEQVIGPDSITVNAAHMYLHGIRAHGDMVIGSSTCSLTSTVANGTPVANDDALSTDEDTPLTLSAPGLLANDTDPDGDMLTATDAQAVVTIGANGPCCPHVRFPSDPSNGTVAILATGALTYTPDANFAGTDTFTYVARDARGAWDDATVTVNVTDAPEAPVAVDDFDQAFAGTPLVLPAPGVLINDTDTDGDALSAGSPSDPANGSVTLAADGSFTYTPDPGFLGTDTFSYTASDGTGRSDTALVTILVTVHGATIVKDIAPGSRASNPSKVVSLEDSAYFLTRDGPTQGLWRTDGTTAGTVLVKSFTSVGSDNPLTVMGGAMYFTADEDGSTGQELWKSDGTAAGTVLVKDINVTPNGSSSPRNFKVIGSTLYFSAAFEGSFHLQLWKTDGTGAGTVMIKNFVHPPSSFSSFGSTLYFAVDDGFTGQELWKSDGTADGTVLVKDINTQPTSTGTRGSHPLGMTVMGSSLFFTASDGINGVELWKTDGTEAGTVMVKDIHVGDRWSSGSPTGLTAFGDTLLFSATDGATNGGYELWKTDGTQAGTVMVKNIRATGDSLPNEDGLRAEFGVFGNMVLFSANGGGGSKGFELWRTDGSEEGTSFVKDINPGLADSTPGEFTVVDDVVYFSAVTAARGRELWKTDGTAAGTVLAQDIDPGGADSLELNNSSERTLTSALGTLFLSARTAAHGTELWRRAPPPSGDTRPTQLSVGDLAVVEGSSGTTTAVFTVTRSGITAGPSTVKYKTSGGTATSGTDYTALTTLTTLTFGAGETTKTVTVDVTGDALPEAHETFNLILSAPSGAVLADASGTAKIRNDDGAAYLAVNDVTVTEGDSDSTPASFSVTRSGNTTGATTVKYKTNTGTAGTGDFTGTSLTSLSFAAGETTKIVTVNVTGDTVDEKNEKFTLDLSAPVGATIADAAGTATLVDDEGTVTPGPSTFVSVDNVVVNEGNTGATPAAFTVTRSGDTDLASTVKYKTSGGTATAGADYTAIATLGTLSFAAGEISKTVSVDVAGDGLPEADETFNLVLSAPTGAVIADASGTATIVNDDGSAYLAVDNVAVTEGNSGTTTATFTVTRSGNTTGASSVKVKTSGGTATAGTDYTAVALTTVDFAAVETTKTVTVDIIGDTTKEANETFKLVLSTPVGAVTSDTSGTATIVNDE